MWSRQGSARSAAVWYVFGVGSVWKNCAYATDAGRLSRWAVYASATSSNLRKCAEGAVWCGTRSGSCASHGQTACATSVRAARPPPQTPCTFALLMQCLRCDGQPVDIVRNALASANKFLYWIGEGTPTKCEVYDRLAAKSRGFPLN